MSKMTKRRSCEMLLEGPRRLPPWVPMRVAEVARALHRSPYPSRPVMRGARLLTCVGPDPTKRSYLEAWEVVVAGRPYRVSRNRDAVKIEEPPPETRIRKGRPPERREGEKIVRACAERFGPDMAPGNWTRVLLEHGTELWTNRDWAGASAWYRWLPSTASPLAGRWEAQTEEDREALDQYIRDQGRLPAEGEVWRCPRDSGWCDGRVCAENGIVCPQADPEPDLTSSADRPVAPRYVKRMSGAWGDAEPEDLTLWEGIPEERRQVRYGGYAWRLHGPERHWRPWAPGREGFWRAYEETWKEAEPELSDWVRRLAKRLRPGHPESSPRPRTPVATRLPTHAQARPQEGRPWGVVFGGVRHLLLSQAARVTLCDVIVPPLAQLPEEVVLHAERIVACPECDAIRSWWSPEDIEEAYGWPPKDHWAPGGLRTRRRLRAARSLLGMACHLPTYLADALAERAESDRAGDARRVLRSPTAWTNRWRPRG